jgi:signal transduction histidine kinase
LNKQEAPSRRLDWVLFGLRWLLIASGLILLITSRDVTGSVVSAQGVVLSIVVASMYNLLLAALILVGLSSKLVDSVSAIGDTVLALLFFWASGGSPLVLLGAGLLPTIVTSLRMGQVVGLSVAMMLAVLGFIFTAIAGGIGNRGAVLILTALFLLLAATLTSIRNDGGTTRSKGKVSAGSNSENERARDLNERARAIAQMATTLGGTLDYNRVLEAVLSVGTLGLKKMGPDERMIGMVMLFQKNELCVITSRGLTRQDEKKCAPGQQGILGQTLNQAEPVFAASVTDYPELKYFAGFQDARSVLTIPLRAGYDYYGLVVFGTTEPDAFSPEHIELLTAIGTQATMALQNAVLYGNIRKEKERIVEVEEDARKKLARDLHDGPTQSIAAIAMRVSYIRRLLEKNPAEVADELQKVEDLARRTTKEIRDMLFTLRPLVLETQGLAPALEQFAQKMKETHNLNVVVQVLKETEDQLPSQVQGVLFYIFEEAVGNARKHAQAEHIYVRLYQRENYAIAEIQDDGVGFDIEAVTTNYDQRGSLGMVNMRERAALIEGNLRIDSAKGKGTKISVIIPLKDKPGSGDNSGSGQPSPRRASQLTQNNARTSPLK